MASIYSNAELVLAAAAASSADEGFLGHDRHIKESSVEVPSKSGAGPSLRLKYRMSPLFYTESTGDCDPLNWDPLDRRGWTLQERVLARRYLAFGRREMTWTVSQYLIQVVHLILGQDDSWTNMFRNNLTLDLEFLAFTTVIDTLALFTTILFI